MSSSEAASRYGRVQMEPRLVELQASVLSQTLNGDMAPGPPPPPTRPRTTPSPIISQHKTTSISKHYALNNQILQAFDRLYLENKYKVAYAVGMRFVETALLEIPKHGYFYSTRHEEERLESNTDALRVTSLLQRILQDEVQQEKRELHRVQKLERLAKEQRVSALDYERDRQRVEQELHEEENIFEGSLCGSLLDYTESVSAAICPSHHRTTNQEDVHREPKPKQQQRTRGLSYGDRHAPPSPVRKTTSELELERALFLSGLQVTPSPSEISTAPQKPCVVPAPLVPKPAIDIYTQCKVYHEEFLTHLDHTQRIRISRVATHQGRLVGSINGCTVIAPLLCIHHFHNCEGNSSVDAGLPDEAIIQVIDVETPVVLPQVRDKLGLFKDALIIPSDVHDYLIEQQLLAQEQFVTVMGGNILNNAHLNNFVNSLLKPDEKRFEGKRMAATLFFQEHVVAVHKLRRENGAVWFDLIDSLPYEEFLSRTPFDNDAASRSSSEQRDGPESMTSEHSFHHSSSNLSSFLEDDYYVPDAARIRCLDKESLMAALRWFACSKFTDENKSYIDAYPWDDMNSDFDPRVFQAFIWAEV